MTETSNPTATLDAYQIAEIISEYDRQIRANNSPEWNTIEAVAYDDEGEVYYEILDVAEAMGHTLTDADCHTISNAAEQYKATLRSEIDG